ncbi:MAG TPA: polysaccharide deacetylase family protein [Pseudonocardiaceae bacterium]|nr:polysaccharide deacetylase family protein [Pseudonocardiaceae bacterium]
MLPFVLMYHSITDYADYADDPYLITVTPDRLDRQLRWLRRRGLRGTSMGELVAAWRSGRAAGLVGLTFDDGYADFAHHALPVLRRHGCTATVFVLAGQLGGHNVWDADGPRKPLLTADQVRAVADAGMEIGSHGLRHVCLAAAEDAVLAEEVIASRTVLREISGQPVDGFCYPYGRLDQRAVDAVRAAGYDYGAAIWRSAFTGPSALPRTYIGDHDRAPHLFAKRIRHRFGFTRKA